jgi:hypothetical protein
MMKKKTQNVVDGGRKALSLYIAAGLLSLVGGPAKAQSYSVDEYNQNLIQHGVSWSSKNSPAFMPSLYLGFSPKVETANQIHFRLGRGNQIRLTAVMDEMTVLTYPYNLKARYDLVKKSVDQKYIQIQAQNQFSLFEKVILSSGVLGLIQDFETGKISEADYKVKSIQLIKKLNPGRVFDFKMNFSDVVSRWALTSLANYLKQTSAAEFKSYALKNPQQTIALVNEILPGRMNVISVDEPLIQSLDQVVQMLSKNGVDISSVQKMVSFVQSTTQNRYQIQCSTLSTCQVSVLEFTAIYPNGSTIDATTDRIGNRIPRIREVGALSFLDNPGRFDVDHIRNENFYGWAPKMDYTPEGNGIHNPAVMTNLTLDAFKNLITEFNIPTDHTKLWIVSRGNVSHGCTRMSAGHILEVRNIFPTTNDEMKKVKYFGNASTDYDLFDIDGTGTLKVMGVQYYLSYGLMSGEGEGYREGKFLIPESFNKSAFYQQLYGKQQFREENGEVLFINPYLSQFHLEKSGQVRAKAFSQQYKGEFKLYEQSYEKDKLQLFTMASPLMSSLVISVDNESRGKRLVRLFGRVNGCGPFAARFEKCSEKNYLNELAALEPQLTKVK